MDSTPHAVGGVASAHSDASPSPPTTTITPDVLTIEQLAALLQVPKSYIYRNHHKWPFTKKLSHKKVRYDLKGYEKWRAKLGAT